MATATQMRDAMDDAILALSTGAQSYTVMGRTVTRANLDSLLKARDYYAKRAASTSDDGRNYAVLGDMTGHPNSVTPSNYGGEY